MNAKIQKIITGRFGSACDRFCNSVWYSVAIGAVCIIAHAFCIPIVGAAFLVLLLVPALLFCKNSFVLVSFLLMCTFVISQETNPQTGYYNNVAYIIILSLLLAIAVAAFVFNIIYYGKWKMIFKRAYLTLSLVFLTVALWLSGVGSSTLTWTGFGLAISIAAAMFLPYAMIINCGEYQGQKTVKKFAYAIIIAAFVIIIDYFEKFVANGFDMDYQTVKGYLQLGFVGPNTGAAIITMSVPMTFYLVYTSKYGYLWMTAVVLETISVILTFSRASLVVVVPGVVIVSIALCFKMKQNRLGYWIAFGICAVGAIAVCVAFRNVLVEHIKELFVGNTTGSGRTYLWTLGFSAWKNYPIFGVGFGFLLLNGYWYFSFHCTPLTYLYCGGIIAFAAYLYHRYRTVKLVFSAKLTPERVFAALTVLAMLCNALLDIAMTNATHLLYYSVLLAVIEHDAVAVKSAKTVNQTNDTNDTKQIDNIK